MRGDEEIKALKQDVVALSEILRTLVRVLFCGFPEHEVLEGLERLEEMITRAGLERRPK